MSSSSARRLKDRSGGGASRDVSVKPSKTLTPVSGSSKRTSFDGSHKISSAGKENPRPTSKAPAMIQKPSIRAVPPVNKAAAIAVSEGETRVRWSTSSVPRGRSSSPSEFIRGPADVRRERRVSVDRNGRGPVGENDPLVLDRGKGSSFVRGSDSDKQRAGAMTNASAIAGGGGLTELRSFRELKGNIKLRANTDKNDRISEAKQPDNKEKFECKSYGVKVQGNHSGGYNSSLMKSNRLDVDEASRNDINDKSSVSDKLQRVFHVEKEQEEKLCFVSESSSAAVKDCQDVNSSLEPMKKWETKNLEITKNNGSVGGEGGPSNKYPSKLHEKLAFLEGKVQRIASDIKKTKELLDLNNSDSSKMILTDIQQKISGIENEIGHGAVISNGKVGLANMNNIDTKMALKSENNEADNIRILAKGANTKELEDRLFPHHKLLRNRMSLKSSSGSSQGNRLHAMEPTNEVKVEDMSVCPVDENPIALEFLASLNKEQKKVTTRSEQGGMEFCEVLEMDANPSAELQDSSNPFKHKQESDIILTTDEILDEFDDQENKQGTLVSEEIDDNCNYQLNEIGNKTSTGGWFVSDGEAVLLAHNDGSCSFYDITNSEEKTIYRPLQGISPNIWRDCWIIRAPGTDGCSGRYVVAASAGNTMDAGFCSWDFYSKDIRAFHIEGELNSLRAALAPLPSNIVNRRIASSNILVPAAEQWWYKPCGPLIISTASCQKTVKVFDIRDGEEVMNWELQKPVSPLDYSSPLQWRNRGKIVLAETETISLWDVTSINAQPLLSVHSSGRRITALHVNNTDAELGGGVRQRVSSSEAEGKDGVFCTADSINVMDFRSPSGIGLKIPKAGLGAQSVFSRGDSVYVGCSSARSGGKKQASSVVHQFSLREQKLFSTYALPESNAHIHHSAITQVWGNSNLVMAVSGLGLFVFDALKDEDLQSSVEDVSTQVVREVVGPDDLYSPSFDYSASRALLISRDRPASWRQLS